MSKVIKIISVLLISSINFTTGALAQDADVVKGATGFMLWGDEGWDGSGYEYRVDGCKTVYEQFIPMNMELGVPAFMAKFSMDWNKLNCLRVSDLTMF